uniref:Potassium channel, subfamily K, member 4a n=1 Tax=Cyprinodon variegatus TaxID=28743 RepID=A0A3Q2CJA3_CYPVA
MRCTTLITLLTGVMLYLGMGALVFVNLEAPEESKAHTTLLKAKQVFLENNSCITEVDFQELKLVSAIEAGLDISSLSPNLTTRWDMGSAFFFCGTIITTIGFGNLSPRTWFGQLFCVCYALVGIPMFGFLLAGVGDHMGTVLRRAVAKIEKLFLKRKIRPTTVRVMSAVLSILIGCLIFLAVPTVVFQKVEKWSFLESLYFVVITLTTVGFGDYVPGGTIFKPLVLLWIVFGLAYFASILTMIGNWLRVLSKRTRAEMEELRAHATDWTQNMEFRIPNPLEFNDPFLLQRRRWKRSERRRIRRGAHGTLGYWPRPRASGEAGVPNAALGSRADAVVGVQGHGRSCHQVLARSFSLPVARSTSELDSRTAAILNDSLSGSEFAFDSRSDGSPESLSFSKSGSESTSACSQSLAESASFCPHPHTPELHPPSPQGSAASSPDCQLLDFFGETLAYIDESSDTLSDLTEPTASKEKRRRPHKPKRRSMKKGLSPGWSLLHLRRPSLQPPSNPPTPPPDCSSSDLSVSEIQTDSNPGL